METKKIYSGKIQGGGYGFWLSPDGLDPYIELAPEQHDALFKNLQSGQIIKWLEDGTPYISDPPEPTVEELTQQYVAMIQSRLDNFAKSRGYDGIHSAATYENDPDPVFAREGQYCVALRSKTWRKCYEIMDAVLSGQRAAPTFEGLIAELPAMEWPE